MGSDIVSNLAVALYIFSIDRIFLIQPRIDCLPALRRGGQRVGVIRRS